MACGHGHGRRWRQAHDDCHDQIRVRRGLCKHCDLTLTVLPAWSVTGALYNLPARREALGRLAEGETLEASAPVCRDPDRIADPSTVRRWFWRRIAGLRFFFSPTILPGISAPPPAFWLWSTLPHDECLS